MMLGQIVRIVVRISGGMVLGAVPGALYGGVVGAVHLGVYGRWDRVPAFAVGCVMVGALCGLLGGIKWALAAEAGPDRPDRVLDRHPGSNTVLVVKVDHVHAQSPQAGVAAFPDVRRVAVDAPGATFLPRGQLFFHLCCCRAGSAHNSIP